MHTHRLPAALAILIAAGPAAAQGWAWSAEATLGSDLTERGISPWPRQPVAQGLLGLTDGAAWAVSLSATAPLERTEGAEAQWVLRGTRYGTVGNDWQWRAGLASYAYPRGDWRGYDRSELTLGGSWRDLLSLELSATRLHEGDQRPTWAADLGLRWPLGDGFSAAAGLGRAELVGWPRWCYTYGDAGLLWQQGPWRASLRALMIGGGRVRSLMGDAAEPHASASIGYTF